MNALKFIQETIRDLESRGKNRIEIGKLLGVSGPMISRYLSGADDAEGKRAYPEPGISVLESAIKLRGGNFARALPDWNEDKQIAQTFPLVGAVDAGEVTYADHTVAMQVDIVEHAWKRSIFWKLTTGPVVCLEVRGASMSPRYPNGTLIACRQPADVRQLPFNSPAILRFRDEHTFKLLGQGPPGFWAAAPINPEFKTIYMKFAEATVEYVVVGSANASIPDDKEGSHLLLRSSRGKVRPAVDLIT
ncbi:LexA family transcriptional regulator [Candidatus Sumerlaeota bacterium]|nr:LexA family transcriptional regulator [Candidatus Sumerlaeota bacterium]